jgi:hypothetical protein
MEKFLVFVFLPSFSSLLKFFFKIFISTELIRFKTNKIESIRLKTDFKELNVRIL